MLEKLLCKNKEQKNLKQKTLGEQDDDFEQVPELQWRTGV